MLAGGTLIIIVSCCWMLSYGVQLALSSGQWQGRLGGSCHRHLPALPRRDGLSDSIQRTSASSKMNSQQPRGPTGHHPSAQGKRPGFTPQTYWRPVGPRSGLASFHAQPLSRTLGAQDSNQPRVAVFAKQTANTKRIRAPPSLRACPTKRRRRSLRDRYDFTAPFIVLRSFYMLSGAFIWAKANPS